MVWSFQLTPWVLPPVLALLLLAREWVFLWPRRRESGSVALLVLGAVAGLWASVQLVASTLPDITARIALFRMQVLLSSLVPVAWVGFCLLVSGKRRMLRAPPAALLYVLTVVTVVLAVRPSAAWLIVADVTTTPAGADYAGLTVRPGPWYWVHLATRAGAVALGGAVVIRHLLRLPATRGWATLPGLAALLVVVPSIPQVLDGTVAPWRDLSATAFGIAVALLGWGVLRHRLLDLGPVARTLVMVELRDPLVVLDGRGRIVDLNRAAERILGLQVYGDVPLALGTLWASARERADRYADVTLPVLDGPGADQRREDGRRPRRSFEVTLTPLGPKDRSGGQTALLLRDVTERDRMERELRATTKALRAANEELERLANTDSLTSLANRRHFIEALEGEMDRSRRYDRPLSLVLLDLDDFKNVNDSFGHGTGDAVLRTTADVMRSVCRDVDLPARLGGEELAILLPETRDEGARTLAERLRGRLEDREHRSREDEAFTVTASLGVATSEGSEPTSTEAFLQRADAALYQAKEDGRNRVVVAPAPGDAEGPEER